MRAVSSLIALLLVVGVALAAATLASRMVMSRVVEASEPPTHLQLVEGRVSRPHPRILVFEAVFYNPSGRVLLVHPLALTVYSGGFSHRVEARVVEATPLKLSPGETGKLEVAGELEATVHRGVAVLTVKVVDAETGGWYQDVIVTPIR